MDIHMQPSFEEFGKSPPHLWAHGPSTLLVYDFSIFF
jgi:hypothetical protein